MKKYIVLLIAWIMSIAYLYHPADFLAVYVSMAVEGHGFDTLALYADTGKGFQPTLSTTVSVTPGKEINRYKLKLAIPRATPPKALRLDPTTISSATLRIQEITVRWQGKQEKTFRGSDLWAWQAANHLQETTPGKNQQRIFRITGNDPMLVLPAITDFIAPPTLSDYFPTWQGWLIIAVGGLFILLAAFPGALKELQFSERFAGEQGFIFFVSAALPIALFWILYHGALSDWFMNDDPCLLNTLSVTGTIAPFFEPNKSIVWPLPAVNFTPLLSFSLGTDFNLFFLEPRGYYWHQLISFSLSIFAVFFVLNQFLPPLLSSLIISSFVISAPSAETAHFLMERHYVEGLGLAAISFLCYVFAARKNVVYLAWLGAVFYLLAASAKEIYVPLSIILLFLPLEEKWQRRWQMIMPYLLFMIVYIVWRWYMLGSQQLVGGYAAMNPTVHRYPNLNDILLFPKKYLVLTQWTVIHILLILSAFLGFLILSMRKFKQFGFYALIWAAAVFMPIIPVLPILTLRYLFLITLMIYMAVGITVYYWIKEKFMLIALWMVLLVSGLSALQTYNNRNLLPWVKQQKTEGQFLLHGREKSKTLLLEPESHCFEMYRQFRAWMMIPPAADTTRRHTPDCQAITLYPDKTKFLRYMNGELLEDNNIQAFCQMKR